MSEPGLSGKQNKINSDDGNSELKEMWMKAFDFYGEKWFLFFLRPKMRIELHWYTAKRALKNLLKKKMKIKSFGIFCSYFNSRTLCNVAVRAVEKRNWKLLRHKGAWRGQKTAGTPRKALMCRGHRLRCPRKRGHQHIDLLTGHHLGEIRAQHPAQHKGGWNKTGKGRTRCTFARNVWCWGLNLVCKVTAGLGNSNRNG